MVFEEKMAAGNGPVTVDGVVPVHLWWAEESVAVSVVVAHLEVLFGVVGWARSVAPAASGVIRRWLADAWFGRPAEEDLHSGRSREKPPMFSALPPDKAAHRDCLPNIFRLGPSTARASLEFEVVEVHSRPLSREESADSR